MNRIRHLIGNQPETHHDNGMNVNQLRENHQFLADDDDDQSTMFEGNNESVQNGSALNRVISESSTIGDLQRLGFVNRCPAFNSQRTMVFVAVLLAKGFYCFPSDISFKKFLDNKRKFDNLDTNAGLGIPIFHIVSLGIVKTMFYRKAPSLKIYKYVLINSEIEKPPLDSELISENGSFKLYKFLFCSVFQAILDHYSRVEYKFVFHPANPTDCVPEELVMANHVQRRNTDTKINGVNLRWYGTTGFSSPFGSGNFKLLVLDDEMPSMMDQQTSDEYDAYAKTHKSRQLGRLPIWAKYSDATGTIIPKKRTQRLAEFEIGESNPNNGVPSLGILDIPWESQALTCMCMVLREFETRKDGRSSSLMTTGDFMAGPIM